MGFWLMLIGLCVLVAFGSIIASCFVSNDENVIFWIITVVMVFFVVLMYKPLAKSVDDFARAEGCIQTTTVKTNNYSKNGDVYMIKGKTYAEDLMANSDADYGADINTFEAVGKKPKYRAVLKETCVDKSKLISKLSLRDYPSFLAKLAHGSSRQLIIYKGGLH